MSIKELQEQLKAKDELINKQQREIEYLEKRIKELEFKEIKQHNERNAGRKSNITKEQILKINKMHSEGQSYGAIAKEVGISKAYVYKLINKQYNVHDSNQMMTKEAYEKYRERVNILRKELRDMGHTHKLTEDLPPYEEYIKQF